MSEAIAYTPIALVGAPVALVIGAVIGMYGASKALSEFSQDLWLTADQRESALRTAVDQKFMELETAHCQLDVCSKPSELDRKVLAVHAMNLALQDSAALSWLAQQESGLQLDRINHMTSSLLQGMKLQEGFSAQALSELEAAENNLRHIAEKAHRTLIEIEGQVLRESVGSSLKKLGYVVDQRGQVLRGTKGATTVWMQLDERANMDMDISGFSGISCQKEIKRIEDELSRSGVELKRTKTSFHGKEEGGSVAASMKEIFSSPKAVSANHSKARNNRVVRKSLSGRKSLSSNQTLTSGRKL